MTSSGSSGEPWHDELALAQVALSDTCQWQLSPRQWSELASIVRAMTAAHDARDIGAFRRCSEDLELLGPSRIFLIRDDEEAARAVPVQVLELVNELQGEIRYRQSDGLAVEGER